MKTINKDINNKNKKSMKQTTRQRRGRPWQWLQVTALMLVMLAGGSSAAQADRMKNNDYFTMSNQYDHLHFSLLAADLDGANSYSKSGTIKATCNGTTYEILKIHSTGSGDDDGNSWNVYGYDPNGSDWGGVCYITNTSTGGETKVDRGNSDNNYSVKKGEDDEYPTIEIDFYWPAKMAGKTWSFKYDFYHDQNLRVAGGDYSMNLGSTHLGYTAADYNYKTVNVADYKYERTAMDKITFTTPALPKGDIPSKLADYRWHEAFYDLTFTYTIPTTGGKTEKHSVEKKGLQCKSDETKYEIEIPAEYQKFTRLDLEVKATDMLKNSDGNHYWLSEPTYELQDIFTNAPQPSSLVAEYRQFDSEAVLTWQAFATGSKYLHSSVPYIYRMQTNENGTPVSGASWEKRGTLPEVSTTQNMTYTDNKGLSSGTYYKYMVVNVPKEWVNKGVSQTDLNSPTDELLQRLPYVESAVMSTKPQVTISDLQQDLSETAEVRLTWRYTRVPVKAQTVNFKVMRRTSKESGWVVHAKDVSAPSNPKDGEVGAYVDKDLPDNKTRYDYKVVLELDGADPFESDVVTAGLIDGTTVQGITATKGTYVGSVRVTWNTRQVGTGSNTYMLYRRYADSDADFGEPITNILGTAQQTQFTFEDKNAVPGYYYEYKVEIYGADGTYQNTLTDIGFCQTGGSISGDVTFETGAGVPNVRMDLVPTDDSGTSLHGYSKRFDGVSTGVQWQADSTETAKLFGPGKNFTMQMFVNPDSALTEGAVIGEIPGEGRLALGKQTAGGYELTLSKPNYVEPVVVDTVWSDPIVVEPTLPKSTKTTNLSTLTGNYTATHAETLTGTLSGNYKVSIADGAIVYIKDVTINGVNVSSCNWAGINCMGDATIVLEGTNTVKGFQMKYPAIHIPQGKTLTIKGNGTLNASSNGGGAGIGGGMEVACGNIVIEGGNINASGDHYAAEYNYGSGAGIGGSWHGPCGNITIKGGIINVTGGSGAAGIGGGSYSSCGNITIASSVTRVTANTNGVESNPCIGSGTNGTCGTVTIGGTVTGNINNWTHTYTGDGSWADIFKVERYGYTLPAEVVKPGYTIPGYITHGNATATGVALPSKTYSLLTVTRDGSNLAFSVNSGAAKSLTATKQEHLAHFSLGGADSLKTDAQGFHGNITEVRVFDHALTDAETKSYADRLLNGSETGLKLYWPMDEGLSRHVYDASYTSGLPNGRHATVGNAVTTSAIVPTKEQLSRYGMTNDKGEYTIRGIPFAGGGTTYRVVPQLGVHEFDPTSTPLFVSPTSQTHNNVKFKDKSSFPMDGYVYYEGTNIPVEGVMFYIDNQLVTGNGEAKQTNADGYYSISVPIGEHYVEARKEGHTFVNNGRYPTKNTRNFDRAMTYDFADNTLTRFVGRVGGGERNDTLAVGFGESKNNIGMATIQLRLNNESFSFNCADDHISRVTTTRTWQSDTVAVKSRAWTEGGDASRFINIRTDSVTGEFSALLPPLKYTIKSVTLDADEKAKSDPVGADLQSALSGIEFIVGEEVDMTSPKSLRADTLKIYDDAGTVTEKRVHNYNAKKVFTHFAQPTLDIVERDNAEGVFGIKSYSEVTAQGDTLKIDNLWSLDKNGKPEYLLGYPVYQMGDKTEFRFTAYEEYVNRDAKEPVVQHIELNGQVVNAINEMADDQSIIYEVPDGSLYAQWDVYNPKTHGCKLDENGEGIYKWGAGLPNIVSPFTRHLTVSMNRNGRTYILKEMDAIVLGNITLGNNFVTKGPDLVDVVLRDPPGAKSKTTLKRGKITRTETLSSGGFYDKSSLLTTWMCGMDLKTAEGSAITGFMVISSTAATFDIKAGVNMETTQNSLTEKTTTTTYSNAISTSASGPYVSTPGDVYVGTATNILIGQARLLHVVKDEEKDAKYKLQVDMARAFGSTVATNFMYSQYELQTVMIPKWKDQRNGFMATAREVADSVAAYAYENNTGRGIYVRWNKPGDADYGIWKYRWVAPDPAKVKEPEVDSVAWCTDQIEAWQNTIRSNEEDKVKSMQAENGFKNFSVDGGSTYSFSERTDNMTVHRTTTNWKVEAVVGGESGYSFNGKLGVNVNLSTENGKQWTEGSGDDEGDYLEWEYTVQDGNRDTDISINQYDSQHKGWSKIFSVFGGQTYNPYHAADSTIYYTPKTQLNAATEQMEQPNMSISLDGNSPQKTITVTDIPAGTETTLTLHCTNLATAHQGVDFSYNLEIQETTNPNGLQILMDGVPITGRSILLTQSETTLKRITLRQTDQSLLNYEGVKIRFCSQYQPLKIYDEITINAYFKPWSSTVELAIDEPVLNTQSDGGQLEMRIRNFNRQFQNLKNVGVEYRFEGNTQWNNMHTWWVNPKDTVGASNSLLPAGNDIRFAVDMQDNISYPEGTYEMRAYTTTPYDKDDVHVYSDVITVIKDLTRPRNLFTPSPSNGILRYGDQMAIEFNEDIVPGYVSDKNVIVTAKLNSQEVQHEVSYQLWPFGEQPKTVNPVFLKGSFSVDFWLNHHQPGTILHIGKNEGSDGATVPGASPSGDADVPGASPSGSAFALSINDDGKVVAKVAGATFTSDKTVPQDKWTFMALSYNANTKTFDMLAQHDTVTVRLFRDVAVSDGVVQAVGYANDNHLYLGHIYGEIHALSLYNIYRDVSIAAAEKYKSKDNYVYGLANHWPMDEGHGTVVGDKRHTHDFVGIDSWQIDNQNYGLSLDTKEGAQADISAIPTTQGDSYAIEMWYQRNGDEGEVVWETATPTAAGDSIDRKKKLCLRYDSLQNLVLDYGLKSQTVVSQENFPNPSLWHHYALNVVRGQAASFYLDGQRMAVIAEADVPVLSGSRLIIGRNNSDMAFADELRIWHAALTESRLLSNMYNTIDTTDVYSRGLVAYYPFEKAGEVNGENTKVGTLENMSPKAVTSTGARPTSGSIILPATRPEGEDALIRNTPPLKNAPDETRLVASPIASERKVVINLTGAGISPRDIEGTTLNITVDQVHDMHGNTSMPIKWTAYVQQNTLKWTRDSVNVFKNYGDPYTFDVVIENKSGNTEYYTLYNMPQWLSLVDYDATSWQPSGDLAPLSTKILRFQVNPLVAVGNYDVTIGLQGNNEILEPLRVVMKVSGEKPDWTVDPTEYLHQMTIVGQVYLNGILMENEESMVAAFIGGECRGVAQPKQVRGAAYVTMNIYGTDDVQHDRDKDVTFRIWDATRGVAYTNAKIAVPATVPDGSPSGQVTFRQDQMLGNYNTPAIWTKSDDVEQQIPLHQNWNWIAFGVEPESPYLDRVFSDLADWQLLVKSRSAVNDYNGAEWGYGTLTSPKVNEMYKLRITRLPSTPADATVPSVMTVSGRQPVAASDPADAAKLAVTLQQGWNWIAYTPLTTMTIDEALAAASPQPGDIVKSQTGVAIYDQNGWEGTLTALEGGHGYMYYSVDGATKSFLYPTGATAQARATRRAVANSSLFTLHSSLFSPVNPTLYPNNMTMVIQLRNGDAVVDTCEVGSFVGDECRGAVRANSKGLYYLVIAGEGAGQPMTLRTCLNNEIVDIDNTQQFVSDGNIGTSWEPYVIDLSVFTGISNITADDDDDGDWWTLQGFKIGRKPTQPGVYIHNGQKVTIKRKK